MRKLSKSIDGRKPKIEIKSDPNDINRDESIEPSEITPEKKSPAASPTPKDLSPSGISKKSNKKS
jgi:hypothetical protein